MHGGGNIHVQSGESGAGSALSETSGVSGIENPRDRSEFWKCELREWANGNAGIKGNSANYGESPRLPRGTDSSLFDRSNWRHSSCVEKILAALPELKRTAAEAPGNYDSFTQAIMTTDTRPKWAAASLHRVGGKNNSHSWLREGAQGMIHPNMATMLAFLVTDAAASAKVLHAALKDVAQRTFNAISVDGDTSTNDTALLLASGVSCSWGAPAIPASGRNYKAFVAALEKVCRKLALAIVSDGEGASRVVEIEVVGAPNDAAAAKVANTIATSPLVKTALSGGDPNWGRILAAAGRAGVKFIPERAAIRMAGIRVYDGGRALPFDEGAAHEKLMASAVPIEMNLRAGRGRARAWTCDFTAEYVHINASYRT